MFLYFFPAYPESMYCSSTIVLTLYVVSYHCCSLLFCILLGDSPACLSSDCPDIVEKVN